MWTLGFLVKVKMIKTVLNKLRKIIRGKDKPMPNEHGPRILLKQNEVCCGEGCCADKASS